MYVFIYLLGVHVPVLPFSFFTVITMGPGHFHLTICPVLRCGFVLSVRSVLFQLYLLDELSFVFPSAVLVKIFQGLGLITWFLD